ncbi:MAG: sigma-70 family RNA polymerase sigma factor [Xanthobacteraceae bacterium]
MTDISVSTPDARVAFDRLLTELRPKLHRYCARMTGSVIDGEDVLQDALVKAIEAFSENPAIANPDGWLFRIAHNAALDFLRRRTRQNKMFTDEDANMIVDPVNIAEDRQAVAASLRTFMSLPIAQRSSVILMDVLGYTLEEIGAVTDATIPGVKAALHRGRVRLRELSAMPTDRPLPALPDAERRRLSSYVERFNARDFDTLRDMLADDVRLELVAKLRLNGRANVGNYFTNYNRNPTWQFTPAIVEGRAAAFVRDPTTAPYFVLLDFTSDGLVNIRDFRFAPYATEGADVTMLE